MGGGASKAPADDSGSRQDQGGSRSRGDNGGGKGKGKSKGKGKGGNGGGGGKAKGKGGGGKGGKGKGKGKKKKEDYKLETFVHEDGTTYQTCVASDGSRYYLDPEVDDWAPFPSEWKKKGKFQAFQKVTFFTWTDVASREEYLCFVDGAGGVPRDGKASRGTTIYYCSFELGEWVEFPEEWRDPRRGTFGEEVDPDEWATKHDPSAVATQSVEAQVSTYEAPDGEVYTTYMGEEVQATWYYLDPKALSWKRMPPSWVRDMKVKAGIPLEEHEQDGVLGGSVEEGNTIEQLEKEVRNLKAKLKLAQKRASRVKEAESLKETLQEENLRTETKFEEIMASNKQLSKEKLDLKKKVRELTKSNRRLKKEAEEASKGVKVEKKLRADAQTEELLTMKDAEIEKLRAKNAEMSSALSAFSDAQNSVRVVGSTIGTLDTQAEDLRKEMKALRRAVFEQQQEFVTIMGDIRSALDAKLEETTRQMQEYQSKYRAESLKRKLLYNQLQELRGNIRVYCRVRGLLPKERQAGFRECVSFPAEGELEVRSEDGKRKTFEFDAVFGPNSTQEDVFEDLEPLVLSAVDGYNVCVFAYGQTGAGKTYTMNGTKNNRGVNYRALDQLFRLTQEDTDADYEIQVSYMEIYQEQIRDLLNPQEAEAGWGKSSSRTKYEIRRGPNGMYVPNITQVTVQSTRDVMSIMAKGDKARSVTATAMNDVSSRSHSIMQVAISSNNRISGAQAFGKLTLVDLAGSERVGKSKASGQALAEAAAINKSLSALGNCISAVGSGKPHVPYRDSKLTYLLQDSIGGSSKTLMVAAAGAAQDNYDETVSTLQFAQRVRAVVLGPAAKNAGGGSSSKARGAGGLVPKLPSGAAASVPLPPRA